MSDFAKRREARQGRTGLFRAVLGALASLTVLGAAGGPAFAGGRMTAAEAYQKALAGEVVLVDVRTPEEWKETGVPAPAHAITMHQNGAQFVAALDAALGGDRSKPLAVICRTGNRTGNLVAPLERAGYGRVFDVSEGMAGGRNGAGWARSGLPVRRWTPETSAPQIAAQP